MAKRYLIPLILATSLFLAVGFYVGEVRDSHSTAAEASRVVKSTGGRLVQLIGYNGSASDQFIQVHNATSLPADTAVAYRSFKVIAGKNFSYDIVDPGLNLDTGIVVCNSSTQGTKTIGSADCWFYVIYQ
jgi:hypothetical protein